MGNSCEACSTMTPETTTRDQIKAEDLYEANVPQREILPDKILNSIPHIASSFTKFHIDSHANTLPSNQ